ncbi:50S ribosomal protein L18Ae [Methanofollis tationis]|uniref:Large ribosomal subunit protein eL20 n=1 Tax=Methanofollis tationis TaxID=81417 RepID=A0A7K4HQS5_9EURY|nr:50S ribosomal protein L18Ae [Methanofollis tationis]NVO67634.1 50S ribosomal protein L18a [Methanofollis tationis]
MENQQYEVTGACQIGGVWQPFTKVIEAQNERIAREHVYTDIGSKHRLKRNYITIKGVTVVGE